LKKILRYSSPKKKSVRGTPLAILISEKGLYAENICPFEINEQQCSHAVVFD
jgi:hypothetical protein